MSRYCDSYKQWVNDCRVKLNLKWTKIAKSVGIDASYVYLIRDEGMIPSRKVSALIGQTLCNDPEEGLIRAGYIPDRYQSLFLDIHVDNTESQPS